MTTRSTGKRVLLLLATAALALGACRSDGGIGRADSQRAMSWNLDVLASHQARDMKATISNADALNDWLYGELTEPVEAMRRTWTLYSEGE